MEKATARIPVRPETRNRLASMLPKSISYDQFITAFIDFMIESRLTLEDIIAIKKPISEMEIEEIGKQIE